MEIHKLFGTSGARAAVGLTIVIDIVRAATVEAVAFAQGASFIIPVGTKEEAFTLKEKHPQYLLMGEEDGYKIRGFDFGNSPTELLTKNLDGNILVHRTSAGTQGLVHADHADNLIFGSFVTAGAILEEIHQQNPNIVSLVCTESEDEVFADYMIAKLKGKEIPFAELKNRLYIDPGVEWFLDQDKEEFPEGDLEIALEINKYNFFCSVKEEDGILVSRKVEITSQKA